MRVTSGVMVDNMMRNLQKNISRLDEYNRQLASGKKFENPSQDPIGVITSMGLKNLVAGSEQYIKNIGHANDWLDNTESALGSQGDILQRARELVVNAANGTLSESDKDSIKGEIVELRKELINIANSKISDRYLFAGQKTKIDSGDPKPFEEGIDGEIEYNGDNKDIRREIGADISMVINTDGQGAFKDSIDTLKALEELLTESDSGTDGIGVVGTDIGLADLSEGLGQMDILIENNLQDRARIGAKVNRLDLSLNRMEDQKHNTRKILSENEDIDIAEVITEMKMQESVYRASLSVGARIIQPTLVDFIK